MIIPSIDIMNKRVVQLRQGKKKMLEVEEPLEVAERFKRFGPLAVIDLDAALGKGNNEEVIGEICAISECRVGGGIRDIEKAKRIVDMGAEKIIIGTQAFKGGNINRAFLKKMVEALGRERIILALDTYRGEIVTKGWREKTGIGIFKVLKEAGRFASEFLITCVEREGCLMGTDIPFFEQVRRITDLPITAAGGITTLDEISALSHLEIDVQLGMSIYTGRIRLEDAFVASLNWDRSVFGLLPVVVVDEDYRVLMLAWANKESVRKTFETSKTCFYSRSRNTLWTKGETSKNFQILLKARTDCDNDTIMFVVRQEGTGACHKGSYTCFGDREFGLGDLYRVIEARIKSGDKNSYTASLSDRRVREKLIEEAGEVTNAITRGEKIWEAADLIYFTTVLLAKEGISINEVMRELKRRRQSPHKKK